MNQPNQSKKILPIIAGITFLGFLDTHLLLPIMALYASGLGASVGVIGFIVGVYSIIHTPANIFFGRLVDRAGYKVPLVVGLIGDVLSMLLYSLIRLPVHLILVRVFHGLSGAVVGPATMSATAHYSVNAKKGRAMSFYGMALGAASLVGYGLSGVIASQLGYKAVFLVGAGMLLVGVALSSFLPGHKQVKATAARASFGETFFEIKGLLKRRGLALSYCSIFAQYFTFGGLVTLLPIYVKDLGMGAFHVGMMLVTFSAMFMMIQIPSGTLSDKMGRRIPIFSGLILGIISLVLLPSLTVFPLLIAVLAVYGIAYGILFPSVSALMVDYTQPQERGLATGLFHALLTAGVAIGAPVMGWVGEVAGVKPGLVLNPIIMAVPLALALIAFRR